jgi:hypothetical protein
MKKILPFLFISLSAWAQNSLTLHVLASPIGIDWSTPKALIKSVARNRWDDSKRPFGHVWVDLKCENRALMLAMSPKELNLLSEFVIGGRGLGILYHTFEGELETGGMVRDELEERKKMGKILSLSYLVNQKQCERMMEYSKAYQAKHIGRAWGLPHRPLYGEGATSAAFAVSFIEVAGVLSDLDKEAWLRGLQLPLEYSGPPVTDHKVNFLKVYFGAEDWAKNGEKSRSLVFYDIEKIYAWLSNEVQKGIRPCADKSIKGICIDVSQRPSAMGNFWQQSLDPIYQKKK